MTTHAPLASFTSLALLASLSLLTSLSLLSLVACDDPGSEADAGSGTEGADTETGPEADEGETAGTGDATLDSDEDGLSDAEELELGTDPLLKDTDEDGYWDSWEVDEGSDPLDGTSWIYRGHWPYNPDKDALTQGSWASASTEVGSVFPRQSFVDQHGDMLDLYDLAGYVVPGAGQPSYILVDISAQWCGPCHNLADWISGVDNPDTADLQLLFPSLRDKVGNHDVWWVTFVVEDAAGGPPTVADSTQWELLHPDDHIPILADEGQQVQPTYGGGQYPFMFLLDPDMKVEYWALSGADASTYMALFFVEHYL